MTTFGQLTDEVLIALSGYTQRQDQATSLASGISATALTLTVAAGSVVSRGMIEIDEELIWVDSYNSATGVVTIAPYGRGYRGTTAAEHSAGTRVTIAPTFPRYNIKQYINQAIGGVYPDLFAVKNTQFNFVAVRTTYQMPSDMIDAQQVTWQTIGPSKEWLPVRHYRMDNMAAQSAWPTGKTISVYDAIVPGRPINVTYTAKPSTLQYDSDDFCETGLPDSAREVIIFGAAWRAVSFLDLGRIPAASAEADAIQSNDPVGSGQNASRLLFQMYQQRLQIEQRKQQEIFPVRVRITR